MSLTINDPRNPLKRFWSGFRYAFLTTFLILFILFSVGIIVDFFYITVGVIVVPAVLATSMGIYFGLIRLAQINTKGFWVGKLVLIFGVVACIFFGGIIFNVLELFFEPPKVP